MPNGNINAERELSHQIQEDYAWICNYDSRICDSKVTREKLEQSPSVNLSRADPDRIDIYMKDNGGTSLKNLVHMGQLYNTGNFQKYDYGMGFNLAVYFSNDVPQIDLSKIKVPVALFIAEQDHIADVHDNKRLQKEIPNVVAFEILKNEDHLSMAFSKDLTYFKKVMAVMDKYKLQERP